MVNIIDTHAHLNDEYFDKTKEAIIASFPLNNLKYVFDVGYNLDSSQKAINLANNHENVFAIIGMHPENCDEYNNEFENFLTQNANNKKVIAIGEIGLDYYWNKENKVTQKQVLVKQLEIANNLSLPVVIHSRDAIGDLILVLKEYKHLLNNGGVIHCFNESVQSYRELKQLGFKFSFGGAITFKNSKNAPELLKAVDVNDILLETDCPYLTPEPLRGKERNQPKNVWLVLNKIAELKNIEPEKLAQISNENVKNVFKRIV